MIVVFHNQPNHVFQNEPPPASWEIVSALVDVGVTEVY